MIVDPSVGLIKRVNKYQYGSRLEPNEVGATSSSTTIRPSSNLLKPQSSIQNKPAATLAQILKTPAPKKPWIQENPNQIAKNIFPPNTHSIPTHPSKTRLFYEFILVDTNSVEIFHNKDDHGNTLF
ncbi:hypothetical protein CR513_15559, partial [Mucuna pruriens]